MVRLVLLGCARNDPVTQRLSLGVGSWLAAVSCFSSVVGHLIENIPSIIVVASPYEFIHALLKNSYLLI